MARTSFLIAVCMGFATSCDEPTATDGGFAGRDASAPGRDGATDAAGIAGEDGGGRDASGGREGRDGGRAGGTSAGSGGAAGNASDAGPDGDDGGGGGDAAPVQVSLGGRVRDAWTASTVADAVVSAEGTVPLVSDSSDASGEYALELADGSAFTPAVSHAGYRPTRNPSLVVAAASLSVDVEIVSVADAQRQYSGLGLTPTAGTSVVFATLRDANGDPLQGVPVADIVLVDGNGVPVALGPYVFGAAGDLEGQATLSTTTAFAGRARVGFLDCPPGDYDLEVDRGGSADLRSTVTCSADGATLVVAEP